MDMTSTRCDEPSALHTAAMSRQFLKWKRAPLGRHGLFPFRKREEKFARECDNEHNALGVVRQVDPDRITPHGGRPGRMTLAATEFSRRFYLHVLPRGFVRIRDFGFLANCSLQLSHPSTRRPTGIQIP